MAKKKKSVPVGICR